MDVSTQEVDFKQPVDTFEAITNGLSPKTFILNPSERNHIEKQTQEIDDRDWNHELISQNFQGDIQTGSELIESIAEGVADIHEALLKRNRIPPGYVFPVIELSRQAKNDSASTSIQGNEEVLDDGRRAIEITKSTIELNTGYVERLSSYNGPLTFTNDEGIVEKIGTNKDILYAMGVEEGAHSAYIQTHPEELTEKSRLPEGSTTKATTEYDSSNQEYHGLGWRIRAIMDKRDRGDLTPKEAENMLWPLQQRLNRAMIFRRQIQKNS